MKRNCRKKHLKNGFRIFLKDIHLKIYIKIDVLNDNQNFANIQRLHIRSVFDTSKLIRQNFISKFLSYLTNIVIVFYSILILRPFLIWLAEIFVFRSSSISFHIRAKCNSILFFISHFNFLSVLQTGETYTFSTDLAY